MTREERSARIAIAVRVATVACIVVVVCCAASAVSVWFVLIGTAAEALIASACFYAAFEAFDERIRRRPD
jgi:xanthine/uracil permease